MGLDMYLTASKFLFDYKDKDEKKKLKKIFNQEINEVKFEVGYWRKANAIHKWFVDNVQKGADNCGTYYVNRDDLIKLKELCEQILKHNSLASELLPTQEGFFFGSYEYDEYYFTDLENTIKIIDKCLELNEEYDIEYHSSW